MDGARPPSRSPGLLLALALALSGAPWAGAGDCKGQRQVLRGTEGFVSDGPGNYSVNGNCEWLIEAPSSRYRVLLTFLFMDTECTYDYLFVYDGDSPRCPLLASLSGSTLPPPLEATSGKMLLHLFSDANYNLLGFNASYRVSLCPRGCAGHGACEPHGQCRCQPGWGGLDCAVPHCDSYCLGHGACDQESDRCWCQPGFVGEACDLALGENQGAGRWYNLSSGDPHFRPRTAAAGAVLPPTGALYIFGGLDLNTALGDLVIYNFTSNLWQRRVLSPSPVARHSHVAVAWQGCLVLCGGELANGFLVSDVWMYRPHEEHWLELAPPNATASLPPGLASHAAAVVDTWLYVFGGRTAVDVFSSQMFRFHLERWQWERVLPAGGKAPAAAGHSMVFHPPSRALLVYGGHRPSTARFSMRVNSTDLFHVDLRHWSPLRGRDPQHGPRERAFHSASLLGNYMVVYGGNVHIHYHEEKCYEDELFFYHLGCHQWVPGQALARSLPHELAGRAAGGRYSHVAAVLQDNVLLVAGGFSGAPRGDLVAYKVPTFVFQVPAQNYHLDYCSMYSESSTCGKDPECSWCLDACQSPAPHSNCPSTGCLGLARLLVDCESCLAFGGAGPPVPHAPGPFGWCVQNETCMPVAEQSRCRVGQISGTYGWWGPRPVFITSLESCQHLNFLPGLHLITYQHPRNDSQPDKVSIVRSTTITLSPSSEMDVSLVYKGFIYPLLAGPPPAPHISVWARVQRLHVIAKLGRAPNAPELEEVGRWAVQQEKETRPLQRPGAQRLFGSPERGNKYLVQVEGHLNSSGTGQSSELTLVWDRTGVPGGSEISYFFLEPFRAGPCPSYPSCLACLADQGCGWCPLSASCHARLGRPGGGGPCGGASVRLVLSPSNCFLCEEYRDCHACSADPFCEWQVNSSKKGDLLCSRRGRQPHAIRAPHDCPVLCHQRSTCTECLSNSSQCAWCQSTRSCFFFATYLAKYPYGDCRGWYDSVHSVPQCLDCARFNTCRDCLQHFECGWCGNTDNPTLGSCLQGDFSGVGGFPNCSVVLWESHGLSPAQPATWSYGQCPDVDECRLGLARCHPFASCRNTPQAYECRCQRGYAGDGTSHCNQTCYEECGHGRCSGPPDYACECELGWTSGLGAGGNRSAGGAQCSVDCGCHFHSSCEAGGPGVCDECQDWTHGEHCHLCRPGSFGDAMSPAGCQACECNGHGLPELGHCHGATGACYCAPPAEGPHCERCAAGFYGDPRNMGTCYRACEGRSLLANLSGSGSLGSRRAGDVPGDLAHCVWVLSASPGLEPCPPAQPCPTISLTLQPDLSTPCMHSYAYAFDGLPAFLDSGEIQADRTLIGAFCGQGRAQPLTVEATSGLLVLYYEANSSEASGFNATFVVHRCRPGCRPTQECWGGRCVCRGGYAGPHCQLRVCPENCSAHAGQGVCNTSLGLCICGDGFGGADCSVPLDPGKIVWETLIDSQLTPDTASRFLHRLGHTMVEGPEATLWMFGGLSLRQGLLGNVYRYSIPERRWTQMLAGTEDGGPGPSPRYFHAAAYVPARQAMVVLGGLAVSGVASDCWVLNLTTLQWRQEQDPLLPAVAGHTLTPRRGISLLLIGGYSPADGFNKQLLEYGVESERWQAGTAAGTPPTGLLFGGLTPPVAPRSVWALGCVPRGDRCRVRFWGAAFPRRDGVGLPRTLQPALPQPDLEPAGPRPGPQAAVSLFPRGGRAAGHHGGGWGPHGDQGLHQPPAALPAQLQHLDPAQPDRVSPPGPAVVDVPMNESVAHAVAAVGGRIYVSGGFSGVALGRMAVLTVPSDPCLVFPGPDACNRSSASCTWCRDSCLSADAAERLGCPAGAAACFPTPRSADECRRLRTCSECLARHPRALSHRSVTMAPPQCKWCTNCPEGACIGSAGSCTSENDCRINQREIFVASNCSEISCEAADCPACTASGKCMWTRQFKRTGETRRILSVQPTYDWTCFSHSLLNVSPMPVESSPPLACPTPCHNHSSCHACLSSKGADGGWQHCVWSVSLRQCMSPTFLPMRCLAGLCGRVLTGTESCTPPCARALQCAHCTRQPRCGWCGRPGENGHGRCLEGGLGGPRHGLAQACGPGATWSFLSCPPENECLNGHHDCNETQTCHDRPHGYECACKAGYTLHNASGLCRPVCQQGCVNGTCVEPNRCRCHFGYVGENCSVECRCNRHSDCAGVGARDQCLECANHTMGAHCEKCRPLFVGSALNGGTCRPCRVFCRGNSDVCISREELAAARRDPARFPLEPSLVPSWVAEGPAEDVAVCVSCQNNSFGEKCESCLHGYFLLEGRCTRCQCNGHADTCNELDGTGCPCQNNTETGPCQNSAQADKKDCYKYQCAKCRDSFHGAPVGGLQCYRLISVEQEFCFDPTSQSNCFHQPNLQHLARGRTVLFGVQPKFTNVDIRITVDVTFGAVDLFVSPAYDTFAVEVDRATGVHAVRVLAPGGAEGGPNGTAPPRLREERPRGLITYLTVREPQAVLVVRGVRDRLVVTYPHELHALKSSRFYLLLLGVGGGGHGGASQGLLFFRQDQAHIDLFVFFSVFFSCFFLFLSACVLLWKAKQCLDLRHEQHRQLQEMTKMASRPFAKVTVCFEPEPGPLAADRLFLPARPHKPPAPPARLKPYPEAPYAAQLRRSEPFLAQLLGCSCPYPSPSFRVGPVTLEPTEDGMAGVATVLLQLPGGNQAPNRSCLGSALVTLRHNLQDYCGGGSHGAGGVRKGLLSHDNLTSMSL
ncbi:multiple epidermal growth factor-like domains protein 8 isoform X7 [Gopherus flavomarginatus]|uniref:multiple epidermal growth factor-like domains protein 8 isoform X7 n=1 Tax=Gopherus flavomarginatus TaxID=286002 RepID=UPI0021CC41D1|nr:multiple epidermal growth factor-like domains protein 8 isoform X7 [Gopherus flavomarginatus]